MVKYDLNDIAFGLEAVKLQNTKVLIVHSSLFSLGMPKDMKVKELPELIFNLLKHLNVENIVVPAFNFDFCKGVTFDRQKTPSRTMGAFSEYVRCLKGSIRSFHPMQSISVNGNLASQIIGSDTPSAFDELSSWGLLEKLNARILLLGSDFNSASIIHLVEQRLNVPYRLWKSFSAKYIDNGIVSFRNYDMFVRRDINEPIMDYSSLKGILITENKINKIRIGGGEIYSFNVSDLINAVTLKLLTNPFYFVSNHKSFLKD